MTVADTVHGTDTQFNYFSISRNPAEFGLYNGGTNHVTLLKAPDKLDFLSPENPQQYDAILKISDFVEGLTFPEGYFYNLEVAQGHQDSINIANQVKNLRLGGRFGIGSGGLRVITIKGGCNDIAFAPNSILESRGSQCDIKIDDWMDQTYNASSFIDLTNLKHIDGKPINVGANYRAHKIIFGPNCKPMFRYGVMITAYWWLKWVVRKILRIPVGAAGPKFLA